MTTKTLSERLTEVEALLAELKRDMKPEQVSDGRPAMGQIWFLLRYDGNSQPMGWGGSPTDFGYLEAGLVHLTRESADRENERRKVIKILRDMAGGFKPDWSDRTQDKFRLIYDYEDMKWYVDNDSYTAIQDCFILPYFATEEAAKSAIAHLGDRLNVLREE